MSRVAELADVLAGLARQLDMDGCEGLSSAVNEAGLELVKQHRLWLRVHKENTRLTRELLEAEEMCNALRLRRLADQGEIAAAEIGKAL